MQNTCGGTLELEEKRNPTNIHEGNKSITDYKQSNKIRLATIFLCFLRCQETMLQHLLIWGKEKRKKNEKRKEFYMKSQCFNANTAE